MLDLGTVKPGSTIRIPFSTFDKDDGSSITMTNFAAADILIYKDGGTTERASTAGFTATTDFDSKTGKHLIVIDLADNTTADFYAAGSEYLVAIDSVTVDAVTVGGWVARFAIGYPGAILDTTIATLASQTSFTLTVGPADDSALVGAVALIHDAASAVQRAMGVVSAYTGSTKTVTLAADPAIFTMAAKDNISFFVPSNTRWLGTTVQTGRDVGASVLLSSGTGTGQVKLSSGYVAPNWGDVGNPTTTVGLTGTTIATTQKVDVETIKTNPVVNGGTITFPTNATVASTTNITAATGVVLSGVTHTGAVIPTVTTTTTATNLTNERAKYMHGAVWIGTAANTNTTNYTDGIMTNPVSTIAAAKTIADSLGLKRFWVQAGVTVTLGAAYDGYVFDGFAYVFTASGGTRSISGSVVRNSINVSGTFSGASPPYFENCEFGTGGATIPACNAMHCEFNSGTITLGTGNYDFIDCASVVAGTSTPVFDCNSPGATQNISFRRWSGGITLNNINSNTTVSIDMVSGGTVTLNGADGNVQIRGMAATITDNRTGTPTLGQNAALNRTVLATPTNITAGTIATVSGNVNGSVGSVATGGITAASIADGAIDAATFSAGAIDATAIATGAIDADALAADAVTEIWAKAMTELSAVPGVTGTVLEALSWVFTLARNKATQTATTQTLYKDDGTTPLATSTVSDDATTYTRGEFS